MSGADLLPHELRFTYHNHRGEVAVRRVHPQSLRWGSTEWHPEPCWLLKAFDLDKQADREFAMTEISTVRAGKPWPLEEQFIRYAQFVELWINRPNVTDAERVSIIKHRPKTAAFAAAIGQLQPADCGMLSLSTVAELRETFSRYLAEDRETNPQRALYNRGRLDAVEEILRLGSQPCT